MPDPAVNREFAKSKLPLQAYLLPATVNIPDLVERLRQHEAGDPVPNVGPNHVFCGEPNYEGGPDGEPADAPSFNEGQFGNPDPKAPAVAVLTPVTTSRPCRTCTRGS